MYVILDQYFFIKYIIFFWSLPKAVENNFISPSLPLLRLDVSQAHIAEEKANIFATYFAECSCLVATENLPPTIPHVGCNIAPVRIRLKEVLRALRRLDTSRPNGIPAIVLRNCTLELSRVPGRGSL